MLDSRQVGYPEQMETDRLILRENTTDDIEQWTRFMKDPLCLEYFTAYQKGEPENNAKIWIEGQIVRYQDGRFGMLSVIEKETDEYLGQCGLLHQVIDGIEELEIGYSLLSSMWGRGYATEASNALKEWAFQNTRVSSLISIIHVENEASKKVAIRNGMTREKTTTYKEISVDIFRIGREASDNEQ